MDGREGFFLRQGDIALLSQFQAGAEGGGPGRRETEGHLGRGTCISGGGLLGQEGERKNPGLSSGEKVVRFRSQSAIQHRGADDGDAMSALRGPSHPLLLGHASIGDLVDATLCSRG